MLWSDGICGMTHFGKALNLIFPKHVWLNSITQWFLVPVFTVSTRKAWHIDPHLCIKYEQECENKLQIMSLAAYTRETNYPLALWSWYRIKFKINGCQYILAQHIIYLIIWHKTDNMLLHLLYHRQEKAGHERLSSSEKEKIRAALFVMDKFSVSWKACHELT